MIDTFLFLFAAALVAWIAVSAYITYRATPGTALITAFEGSATLAWSRLLAASSALVTAAAACADYLGAPGVSDAIKAMIRPEYVPLFGIVVALVTEWARRRTL